MSALGIIIYAMYRTHRVAYDTGAKVSFSFAPKYYIHLNMQLVSNKQTILNENAFHFMHACILHTQFIHSNVHTWYGNCEVHSSSSGWVGVHHLNPYRVANTSCKPLPFVTEFCHGIVDALGISQGKGDILNFNQPLTQTSQAEVTKSSSILSEVDICIPLEEKCGAPLK